MKRENDNHARRFLFIPLSVSLSLSFPLLRHVSWYAVGYDRDVVEGPKPVAVSIFDEPLVLFRDTSGALQCVSDFCPHRASKLSEGQVREGGMGLSREKGLRCAWVRPLLVLGAQIQKPAAERSRGMACYLAGWCRLCGFARCSDDRNHLGFARMLAMLLEESCVCWKAQPLLRALSICFAYTF